MHLAQSSQPVSADNKCFIAGNVQHQPLDGFLGIAIILRVIPELNVIGYLHISSRSEH